MTFSISKDLEFSASHSLEKLPDSHKCARLHGHNYVVRVEIVGHMNELGFVVDYGDLAPLKDYIDRHLDHRDLNTALSLKQPTAERLAQTLHFEFNQILDLPPGAIMAVGVSETPKTWAWFYPFEGKA